MTIQTTASNIMQTGAPLSAPIAAQTSIQLLPEILPGQREQGPGTGGDGYVVVVYNNDHNTYDEVTNILIAATGCTMEEAEIETWEVDHLGKSVVHHGDQEECERAASIIRTIGIKVEVRQE